MIQMDSFRLTRRMLERVYLVPALDLAYVTNPKAACTSMKMALWRGADALNGASTFEDGMNPHSHESGPWLIPEQLTRAHLTSVAYFTVVRDPYARLLSAYLDKKDKPKEDFYIWCEERFGHVPPTFREFILRMVEVPERQRDRHVRPQWMNIMWPYVRFDFVGFVEEMDQTERFLETYGLRVPKGSRTHASDKLDAYYDAETRRVVAEAYGDDLRLWRGELPPASKTVLGDLL